MPLRMPSRRVAKTLLFAACLIPFLTLVVDAVRANLGANPIDKITDVTGTWTLRFVLITLAVTPVRRLTGWNGIVKARRMVGLLAFFYGTLHMLTYVVLDQFFGWTYIWADVAKRPFITMGALGFTLMIPLAITSTAGWIRRLGGRRWALLHRLIYATGIAGVIHYLWLVKSDTTRPLTYAAILVTLFAIRAWYAWRPTKMAARSRPGRVDAGDATGGQATSAARTAR
jgi:methionine sulfoxide reductase heme-binding subunit